MVFRQPEGVIDKYTLRARFTLQSTSKNRPFRGMLKKAASCVLGLLACSRTPRTLRAPKALRPCWTTFLNIPRFR